MARQKFIFGLRGSKLRAAQIWAVIMPAYVLYVYMTSNAIEFLADLIDSAITTDVLDRF